MANDQQRGRRTSNNKTSKATKSLTEQLSGGGGLRIRIGHQLGQQPHQYWKTMDRGQPVLEKQDR